MRVMRTPAMILVSHGSGSPVSSQCSGTGDENEGKSRCRRDRVTEMLDMIVFFFVSAKELLYHLLLR